MITIVFGKPNRSIDVIGYGVDSYKDKNDKEIWRVYGIVNAGMRGRLVSRDSTVVKDFYTDETTVVVFRSSLHEDAVRCKEALDKTIANHFPLFSVEAFKDWLAEEKAKVHTQAPVTAEPVVKENVN